MAHLLGSLAAWAAEHWKRSLAIVAVVLVAIGVAAGTAGGSFDDDFRTPGTESQSAMDVLDKRFPAASGDTANVVFAVDAGTLREPERRAAIERTVEEIRAQPHVTGAPSPFAKNSGQLSDDARIAFVPVQYDGTASALGQEPGQRLEEASKLGDSAGLEVSRNGAIVDQAEQTTAPVGELIGVAVAMIVLTLVFGSVAAMALTLISALIALAGGLLLLQFASAFADFPSFAPTLGIMLGLGAGIDYALLIVGRYREQLASGDSVGHSARVANATAGTSVVAAGAIVVVAITGLLATGIPFVGQMGIGSAIIIAMVAVGAVTVLPTLMGAFARRLRPKRPEDVEPSERFARWAGMITRRPLASAVVGVLVLVLLAVPFASLRLGQPDDGNDRAGSTTRVAYDRLAEGFGPGFNGPLVLAATTPTGGSGQATLSRVERAVAADRDVAVVSPAELSPAGDAAVLTVIPKSSPQDLGCPLVDGSVSPGFEDVRREFERNFAERGELGAACAAYVAGSKVVDLWGGVRDARSGEPWRDDTLVLVYSTSKGLAAMTLALAHSRGWLDYDERVASYWPEFAQAGKERGHGAAAARARGRPAGGRRAARRAPAQGLRPPGGGGCRAAAALEARYASRLPRREPRLVRGGADPARRPAGADAGTLLRRGGRRAARPRGLHRRARRPPA